MRPLRPALDVPPVPGTNGNGAAGYVPDWAAVAGQVTHQADPQSVFATESLAQTLRQLEVYGRDGLPSTPVSVQRGRRLRPPRPEITLTAGDRVSLLTAAPGSPARGQPGGSGTCPGQ
jgi:hypothetical protein